MVDGSGLENRRTRKGTGGSNPSLSARPFVINDLCFREKGRTPSTHRSDFDVSPRSHRLYTAFYLCRLFRSVGDTQIFGHAAAGNS